MNIKSHMETSNHRIYLWWNFISKKIISNPQNGKTQLGKYNSALVKFALYF